MAFSNYMRNKILDLMLGAQSWTAPGTLYVGLSLADPTVDGSGISEPTGGYARKSVTNNLTEWPAASGGLKDNANAITFATATSDWGTVTHWFVSDASTSGNMLAYGEFTTAKQVKNGNTASVAAGALDFTLT